MMDLHQSSSPINEHVVDIVCRSLTSVYIPLISPQFDGDVHLSSALRCLDCGGPRNWSAMDCLEITNNLRNDDERSLEGAIQYTI
jgi:hypothetical protein